MPLNMKLDGRVALVTGAGKGVGEAIARLLAEQGAAVAVNDIDEALACSVQGAIVEAGGRACPAVFDITDYEAVGAGYRRVEQELGAVDILVNNAGMPVGSTWKTASKHVPFRESSPDEWKTWIDLNAYGQIHCIREALPGMCDRGWGRVIQISSTMASRGLNNKEALLGASKAFTEGLLRSVALEVVLDGVTFNAVALGITTNAGEHASPELIERMLAQIPTHRMLEPRAAAAAVAWLASDEAAAITGQVIHVNQGSFHGR